MAKHLGVRRRVKLHDDVDIGKVQPAGGNVGAEQDRGRGRERSVCGERLQGRGSGIGGEVAVQRRHVELGQRGQTLQDLREVTRRLPSAQEVTALPTASTHPVKILDSSTRAHIDDKFAGAAMLRLVLQQANELEQLFRLRGEQVSVL